MDVPGSEMIVDRDLVGRHRTAPGWRRMSIVRRGTVRFRYCWSGLRTTNLHPSRSERTAAVARPRSRAEAVGCVSTSPAATFRISTSNPNSGEPEGVMEQPRVARNWVFVDAARLWHIVLPVIPPDP